MRDEVLTSDSTSEAGGRWPHRCAVVLAFGALLLVLAGGLVTTYRVGMAVPDWPTTFGYGMFSYPLDRMLENFGVTIEHGHRLIASLVGLASIVAMLVAAAGAARGARVLAWLAIARSEATRLGQRAVEDPDALTETEDQVARLAAAGRTNREVAEAVFLTPKSVEGVLSRVYSKLGIRSRAELGAWFAGGPPSSDRETPVSIED